MLGRLQFVHDKSDIIPIPISKNKQYSPTNIKKTNQKEEYSLKQNLFDPTKNSPPNEFMNNLRIRMSMYLKSSPLLSQFEDAEAEAETDDGTNEEVDVDLERKEVSFDKE